MPVVFDMRANDMALGGQGAPLVPAYHAALARSLPQPFAGTLSRRLRQCRRHFQHHLRAGATGDPVAFDTGPGNTLIDQWVAREGGVPFDAGGAIASEGGVDRARRRRAISTTRSSPSPARNRSTATISRSSTPRGLELSDGARTLAAVSAEAILEIGRASAGTAETLDRLRRRAQEPAHRRRPAGRSASARAPRSSSPKTPASTAMPRRPRPGPIWRSGR